VRKQVLQCKKFRFVCNTKEVNIYWYYLPTDFPHTLVSATVWGIYHILRRDFLFYWYCFPTDFPHTLVSATVWGIYHILRRDFLFYWYCFPTDFPHTLGSATVWGIYHILRRDFLFYWYCFPTDFPHILVSATVWGIYHNLRRDFLFYWYCFPTDFPHTLVSATVWGIYHILRRDFLFYWYCFPTDFPHTLVSATVWGIITSWDETFSSLLTMGFHHMTLRNPSISAWPVKLRSYLQACSQRHILKPASCLVSHRITTISTSRPSLNSWQPNLCNIAVIRSEALQLQNCKPFNRIFWPPLMPMYTL